MKEDIFKNLDVYVSHLQVKYIFMFVFVFWVSFALYRKIFVWEINWLLWNSIAKIVMYAVILAKKYSDKHKNYDNVFTTLKFYHEYYK